MKEQRIPKFKSEAEEAQWWFDHREETAQWTADAVREGRTLKLAEVLKKRGGEGTVPTVSIAIDPADVERAHTLAEQRGLRYQTYLKVLLHEALEQESNRVHR